MQEGVSYYYENLLVSKNAEIRRLQSIINDTPNFATVQASYENLLAERTKEIRRLDKELLDLNKDYDELFEANDMLEEKVIRLEMDMNNLMDDYTDVCDCNAYELEQKEKNIKALTAMVQRQEGDIGYLEKLSSAFKETCDDMEAELKCLNVENKALKNARDGLLTWSADEVEILGLEKKANEETIQQLQKDVGTLRYLRDIDDMLFKAMRSTWKRQRVQLEKLNEIRKDGTLKELVRDADLLVGRGFISTVHAMDIRRVVQAIKEDAAK